MKRSIVTLAILGLVGCAEAPVSDPEATTRAKADNPDRPTATRGELELCLARMLRVSKGESAADLPGSDAACATLVERALAWEQIAVAGAGYNDPYQKVVVTRCRAEANPELEYFHYVNVFWSSTDSALTVNGVARYYRSYRLGLDAEPNGLDQEGTASLLVGKNGFVHRHDYRRGFGVTLYVDNELTRDPTKGYLDFQLERKVIDVFACTRFTGTSEDDVSRDLVGDWPSPARP